MSAECSTPLHMTADKGQSKVVRVPMEAGANPNSSTLDGSKALCRVASRGHVDAIKVLLRANLPGWLARWGVVRADQPAGNRRLWRCTRWRAYSEYVAVHTNNVETKACRPMPESVDTKATHTLMLRCRWPCLAEEIREFLPVARVEG